MRYEGSPKHKEPWQRGRRGSLCPKMDYETAQTLLSESELMENKRYAIHEGRPYCAQQHRDDVWHGYPIGFVDVHPTLVNRWIREKRIRRSDVRSHWQGQQ